MKTTSLKTTATSVKADDVVVRKAIERARPSRSSGLRLFYAAVRFDAYPGRLQAQQLPHTNVQLAFKLTRSTVSTVCGARMLPLK